MPFEDRQGELESILENIARIERYVSGVDEASFLVNDEKRDAVERCLQRISEAAARLGPQAEQMCPDIPWREIRGIGNWLRHGYDRIDAKIVWNTVQQDLRPLQMAAMMALARLDGQEPG